MAKGNSHVLANTPFVLIGGCGGYFRTGRYIQYPQSTWSSVHINGSRPHSNLLVDLINAMGIPAVTFGRPDWCTGTLRELTS